MRLTQVVARRNGKAVAIGDMLCGRELQTERCQRPQRGRCRGRFNRIRADESVPKQFHHVIAEIPGKHRDSKGSRRK